MSVECGEQEMITSLSLVTEGECEIRMNPNQVDTKRLSDAQKDGLGSTKEFGQHCSVTQPLLCFLQVTTRFLIDLRRSSQINLNIYIQLIRTKPKHKPICILPELDDSL